LVLATGGDPGPEGKKGRISDMIFN